MNQGFHLQGNFLAKGNLDVCKNLQGKVQGNKMYKEMARKF
jgi:hypothetical protein